MKPRNAIYIGGPPLDPPDDEFFCNECDGVFYSIDDFESHLEHCDPGMNDFGEPNDPPEE